MFNHTFTDTSVLCSSMFFYSVDFRGGSRTAATSTMEHFVIIVNGLDPLTIITKCSIVDVAAVLDLPLDLMLRSY